MNEPGEIEELPGQWSTALTTIFANYTPIVIGYGGNDGSLMKFLEGLEPIKGGIFWCHLSMEEPEARIHKVVECHDGYLVPIMGFDELMLQLWQKLELKDPRPALQVIHDKRKAEWQQQFEELNKRLKEPPKESASEEAAKPVREAAAAVNRLTKEKDWWAWQLKADAEPDHQKQEAIYREGISDFPQSAGLVDNFANFLKDVHKDYDEAERYYRRALELDPNHANNTGNFANFLNDVRKDYDEAERLYHQAIKLDPSDEHWQKQLKRFLETRGQGA